MQIKRIIIVIICLLMISCEKEFLKEEFPNTLLGNFDALWTEFDRYYGAFEAKKINWDSLRIIYRNKLNDYSTDKELYDVMCGLLSNLNDGHVSLYANGFQIFHSSRKYSKTHFPDSKNIEKYDDVIALQELIRGKYLKGTVKPKKTTTYLFFSGRISKSFTTKNLAYICIPSFGIEDYPMDFIDEFVNDVNANCDGAIIDLRFNGGGYTDNFLGTLNRFTDKKRMYIKSKLKNGPGNSDFTAMNDHYSEPKDKPYSSKPIMLLVNGFSASSSEHFMLGMKVLPYATSIGDTTTGALSTVIEKLLPNGWQYRCCPQVIFDLNGKYLTDSNGKYLDGIGLCPDIRVVSYLREINARNDVVLQRAIGELDK